MHQATQPDLSVIPPPLQTVWNITVFRHLQQCFLTPIANDISDILVPYRCPFSPLQSFELCPWHQNHVIPAKLRRNSAQDKVAL